MILMQGLKPITFSIDKRRISVVTLIIFAEVSEAHLSKLDIVPEKFSLDHNLLFSVAFE